MLKFFAHPAQLLVSESVFVQYMGEMHDNGGEPEQVHVQNKWSKSVHMTVITM